MRAVSLTIACLLALACTACGGLPFGSDDPYAPRGVNLWPIYRNQTDAFGNVSRRDVLWPIGYRGTIDRREGTTERHVMWPFYASRTQPGVSASYILELGHYEWGSAFSIEKQRPWGYDLRIADLFGWPLFRCAKSPYETDWWLFPFAHHHSETVAGRRESSGWAVWPLFSWATSSEGRRFRAAPFVWRRSSDDGMDRLVVIPPFVSIHGPMRAFVAVVPFFWHRIWTDGEGRHEHTKAPPFFFRSQDAEGRHFVIPPFFMDFESYRSGKRLTIAWPYVFRRTPRGLPDSHETTSYVWPVFGRTKYENGDSGGQLLWPLFRWRNSLSGLTRDRWFGPVYYRRSGGDVTHGVLGIYGRRTAGGYRGLNLLWGAPPCRPGDVSHFGILWRLFEKRTYAGGRRTSVLYDLLLSKEAPGESVRAFRPFYYRRDSSLGRETSVLGGIYRARRTRYRDDHSLFGFIRWHN